MTCRDEVFETIQVPSILTHLYVPIIMYIGQKGDFSYIAFEKKSWSASKMAESLELVT